MKRDRRKQTGAHFTPKPLADLVAERLVREFSRFDGPVRILDPGCGDGNLLVAMAEALPTGLLRRSTLIGIEDNRDAFEIITSRLKSVGDCTTDLILGDFLGLVGDDTIFSSARRLDPVDVIIANPPYVRTQVLGAQRAQQLAATFGLEGRVDLYQAFLVAMAKVLRPGGLMGVITSNRFLTTRAGASTRRFLRREFDLLEIVDLGDTKLFEAAVLPALIFGVRRATARPISRAAAADFLRVYSTHHESPELESVSSIPAAIRQGRDCCFRVDATVYEVTTGRLRVPADASQPWTMHTADERDWVSTIDRHAACRIEDVAKVRVGIKTTADKVFIRSDWSKLPPNERPQRRHLHRLLSQRNAARWLAQHANGAGLRVLYTHEVVRGKRRPINFPADSPTWRYLRKHRTSLESREYVINAGRRWYEIWVPQDPAAWDYPKIVFPDISPNARFFLDGNGSIVDGNCYWITASDPNDEDLLLLILGVANSSTMARYHDLCFQNRLYAQRRRYLTQYVQRYPLPDRHSPEARDIIRLVRHIMDAKPEGSALDAIEKDIDLAVAEAFGLRVASVMGSPG